MGVGSHPGFLNVCVSPFRMMTDLRFMLGSIRQILVMIGNEANQFLAAGLPGAKEIHYEAIRTSRRQARIHRRVH